jgi:preprotein translocase subunit SecD
MVACSLLTLGVGSGCGPSKQKEKAVDWQKFPVSIELRLATGSPGPQLVPATVYGQNHTVYLHPESQLSNKDIARVEAAKTMSGKGLVLSVWLTAAGAERMAAVTAHHMGDSLAVLVNSVVVSVPTIEDTVDLGTKLPSQIGVPLGPQEANQLASAVSKTWPPKGGR